MTEGKTREIWFKTLYRIAEPVFTTLSQETFKEQFPIEAHDDVKDERAKFSHLEAIGRSLAGIGPWLNLNGLKGQEYKLQQDLYEKVLTSIVNAVDKNSKDFMNYEEGAQPVVDAAFFAQGLLRCWDSIWLKLDVTVQQNIIDCFKMTRKICPGFNNWLLFSAIIESFFIKAGEAYDKVRIDYAIRQHEQWYKGDGIYGDGPTFHWDYYNSFVIHPMLYDVISTTNDYFDDWKSFYDNIVSRLVRYAEIQERLISPDGTYPPIGRSLTYRFGAFQALALVSLKKLLPASLKDSSIRCALTAVLKKTLVEPDIFDSSGWLRIGLYAHQPNLGESYISTGSLYLCLCGFLPLGLSPDDDFWLQEDSKWSTVRIWEGENVTYDKAIQN